MGWVALRTKQLLLDLNSPAALLDFAAWLSLPALSREVWVSNEWARHLHAGGDRFAFEYMKSISILTYIQTEAPKHRSIYLKKKKKKKKKEKYEVLPTLLCSPLA